MSSASIDIYILAMIISHAHEQLIQETKHRERSLNCSSVFSALFRKLPGINPGRPIARWCPVCFSVGCCRHNIRSPGHPPGPSHLPFYLLHRELANKDQLVNSSYASTAQRSPQADSDPGHKSVSSRGPARQGRSIRISRTIQSTTGTAANVNQRLNIAMGFV